MKRIITKLTSFFFLASLFIFPNLIHADFQCTADVSYMITKKGEDRASEVVYSSARAVAETEALAKQGLDKSVRELKIDGREACREAHENLSGCVGAKFESMASVLQRLPFSSRKSVEDAISQDCVAQMGTCGEVKAEVKCVEHNHGDKKSKSAPAAEGGESEPGHDH